MASMFSCKAGLFGYLSTRRDLLYNSCAEELGKLLGGSDKVSHQNEEKMTWETMEDLLPSLRNGCSSSWWCFPLLLTQNNPIIGMQILLH